MLCPVLFFTDSCMATVTCPDFCFFYCVKFGSGYVLAILISCFLRTLLNFGVEYGYED